VRIANALSSLLARLRDATQHDHHCLDRHPRLRRLLQRDLDRHGYADSLAGLHGAQSSLEEAVRLGLEQQRISPSDSEGYRLDARTPALRDDLARLGGKPSDEAVIPMAVPRRLETLIGLLYVLEGSRLGARVIARHVRASLGPAAPLRFFAEADGAAHWPSFVAFAERAVREDEFAEQAALGARAAFALFHHSLDASPAAMRLDDRVASPLVSLEGAK
jgi:heme oxygenase